ncbi:MAG: PQQ-like beta-propeller repeat protein [bacterium]|nr:PQQ-like beta-propeller repeat protein [bacterium]
MPIRILSSLAALALPLTAQIPTDVIVTCESTPLLDPYYKFVDVFGRGTTTVVEQNAFMAVTSLAVDPDTNAQFFWTGAGIAIPGVYRSQIRELARMGQSVWGPWSQVPVARVAIGSNRVVTLDSAGLVEAYAKPTGPGPQIISYTAAGATDLAVTGDLVYTVSSSGVLEYDLATGNSRTVGSFTGGISIAITPTGSQLTLGTVSGDLLRIDPTTGAIVATQSTGLGTITVVGYTRFDTLVWTDGIELYGELTNGPLYTSPTTILDFSVATAVGASVTRYGEGCGAAANTSWASNGPPTLGNSGFALGLTFAPPATACLLALGTNRTTWSATSQPLPADLQPLGAPGCSLLADPQFNLLRVTDLTGSTTQPIPIPNAAGLAGLELTAQWFVPDPTIGTLGASSSEGVAVVIR